MTIREWFHIFAHKISDVVGSPATFVIGVLIIALWGFSGRIFDYSDTWQLVINTGTTIVTFLMVFLIQNTQNRDARAVHLKLDELIRSVKAARNEMVGVENLSDEELDKLQDEFARLREQAEAKLHTIEEHRSRRREASPQHGRREEP
jgi:low affinity Fe/Cu permease